MLVDQHDYHTFQPLLYQLATGLLGTEAVAHPLRDLFHEQPNVTVHEATVTGIDLEARTVEFAEMAAADLRLPRARRSAPASTSSASRAPPSTRSRSTRSRDAVRLKEHVLGRWEAADRDPALVADGALNVVVVGGGPTGVESAGALAELYRANFAEDYPALPQEQARLILVEAGPALLSMFKQDIRTYTKRALEKRSVEVAAGGERRVDRPDPGDAEERHRDPRAHARLGRRAPGEPARPLARGSSSSAAAACRSGPT